MAASTGWRNRPNFHPPGTVFDGRRRGPDFRTCPTKHPVNVSPTEHPKALTPNNWKPLRACLEMSWVISAGYASVCLRNRTEIMMPWNETIRKRYERNPMGYSSDVTDGQWTVVSRLLPGRNRPARARVLCATFGMRSGISRHRAARGRFYRRTFRLFQRCAAISIAGAIMDCCMRSTGPGGHGAPRTEQKRFAHRGCHRQCENN